MSEIVPTPPHVTLPSGQRVFELIGITSVALSLIPSKGLRPSHFSASPHNVAAWSTLSKAALQRALIELQWEQVTAERDRRRKAKLESAEAIEKTIASTTTAALAQAAPFVSLALLSRKRPRRIESLDSPILIVDCDYDNLMTKGEGASLGSQLIHCYAAVRRRRAFVRLVLAGVCEARLTQLARVSGAATWKIHVSRERLERLLSTVETPPPSTTVTSSPLPLPSLSLPSTGIGADACPLLYTTHTTYLTADAPTILWRFEPGEAYVIGGVVDKNRHPGIAASRAATLGFRTARFPLVECGALETSVAAAAGAHRRRVLTTNKAVELCAAVMEGYLGEGDEKMVWRKAITLVLGAESREGAGEGGEGNCVNG